MNFKCPNCSKNDLKPDAPRAYFTCNNCGYHFSKLQAVGVAKR